MHVDNMLSKHCLACQVKGLTISSIASIAIVAFGNTAIAIVVASVVVSSIGTVTIVVTTIAPSSIFACNAASTVCMLADDTR